MERLAKLQPAFKSDGTVTAGNSSGINDGAAALLLCEAQTARRLGLRPMARIVACAVGGRRSRRDGSRTDSGDAQGARARPIGRRAARLVEINEAFASQAVACMRELGLDPAKTNVNGGAIALGHPLGASGARIATTLLHEMARRKARFGLATMCIGVGQGIATVFERVE
jgi:acetyl-CoA acetyltransferase family protein